MNAAEMQKITDWMIDGARSATSPTRLMSETCERLVAAGLPLWRVGVFIRTLHPDIYGRNFIWRPGAEVEVGTVDHNILEAPGFLSSPLMIVFRDGLEVRGRLEDLQSGRFPIFSDLLAEGVTDYIALPLLFIDGVSHASTWTTKQPGGFTDQQVTALRALVPALARVIEIIQWRRTSSLCSTPMSATAPASGS
jgi:adenylate cyclase